MKLQVISDIHGQHSKLIKALEEADKQEWDFRIFLGDYFDRASVEEEKKMIQWLLDNINNEKYRFLLGNHDTWAWKYVKGEMHLSDHQLWQVECNGGEYTYSAINQIMEDSDDTIMDKLNNCFKKMQYINEEFEGYVFTHAGFRVRGDVLVVNNDILSSGGDVGDLIEHKNASHFKSLLPFKYKTKKFVVGHWISWFVDQTLLKRGSSKKIESENDISQEKMPYDLYYSNVWIIDNGSIVNDSIGLHFYNFETMEE